MNNKIDIKSVLIGVCVGVLAILAIGASSPQTSVVGRYQLGGTASHGLVIDTVTGKVWSKHLPQNRGNTDADFAEPKLEALRH